MGTQLFKDSRRVEQQFPRIQNCRLLPARLQFLVELPLHFQSCICQCRARYLAYQ